MLTQGTARKAIQKNLAKEIGDSLLYLHGNVEPKLKFWDEVNDFPFVSIVCTNEVREYLPGSFEWGFVTTNIRVYVKSEDEPIDDLEVILVDIEKILRDKAGSLPIFTDGCTTTDIRIISIDTDGGLLAPHGVGEIVAVVQYQVN